MELNTRRLSRNFFLSFQEKMVYNGETDCYCEEFEEITDKLIILKHFSCFDIWLKYKISSLEMCWSVKNETDQMVPDKVNEFADWWIIFISIPDFPNWSTSTRWSWTAVSWSNSVPIN